MYYSKSIKITTNNFLTQLYRFISMGFIFQGCIHLAKKKKKLTSQRL